MKKIKSRNHSIQSFMLTKENIFTLIIILCVRSKVYNTTVVILLLIRNKRSKYI